MLSHIVYLSDSTNFINWSLIKDILLCSDENNKNKNVTGILFGHGINFLQVLEGDKIIIKNLYEHIAKDERHENIILLDFCPITERKFSGWSMKGFNFNNLPKEQQQHILNKYCPASEYFYLPTEKKSCLAFIDELTQL
ncbi:BLUF domain-containing protein [Colwellia sp. MB02u-6]|uniref:BLUF domain-containing protein n=1 Tax=Colwellia sp. MB02u-6 TaxID=2759824 RepID=UPI0015F46DB2|nr:BLUF domain-containing protein [Colwellia sp. MB02u-6]MBA6327567.1 BLUF domain-containing protein [Colwellia sp. MB02u-6]